MSFISFCCVFLGFDQIFQAIVVSFCTTASWTVAQIMGNWTLEKKFIFSNICITDWEHWQRITLILNSSNSPIISMRVSTPVLSMKNTEEKSKIIVWIDDFSSFNLSISLLSIKNKTIKIRIRILSKNSRMRKIDLVEITWSVKIYCFQATFFAWFGNSYSHKTHKPLYLNPFLTHLFK